MDLYFPQIDFHSLLLWMHQYPRGRWVSQHPPPAHSPAPDLDTFSTYWTAACCPSAPLLIFLWWKRFVVTALFGCHSPSRHYCEVLCLPTPHPRSGFLCCETSPSERIPCNRSSAVSAFLWVSAVQSSQIWTESSSTSWARTMMIMITFFLVCLVFFFLPLPNLGYLHCKPDSVECWVCLKPALQRWLCPLKPASFLNMECSQLTPWEINYGWFNQPRLWLTDSRDSACLFWKGQNDCTKNYMSCSNFWLSRAQAFGGFCLCGRCFWVLACSSLNMSFKLYHALFFI